MKKKKTNPRKKLKTQYEVEREIRKAYRETLKQISIITLTIAAMSAHDVFGFGPKRCEQLAMDMVRKFNDMDEGFFTEQDTLEWFEEYTGMKIDR